jgi:alpha-galactosidase
VIAVDQDRLDVQGYAVAESGGLWVLTKPLADGSRSVLLFNSTGAPATISTTLEQVGFETLGVYRLQDLWTGAVAFTSGVISAQVAPHGVVMYRVS